MPTFAIIPQITTLLSCCPMDSEEFLVGARDDIQKQMIEDWTEQKKKNAIQIVKEEQGIENHYPVIQITMEGEQNLDTILTHRSSLFQTWAGVVYECRMQQDVQPCE